MNGVEQKSKQLSLYLSSVVQPPRPRRQAVKTTRIDIMAAGLYLCVHALQAVMPSSLHPSPYTAIQSRALKCPDDARTNKSERSATHYAFRQRSRSSQARSPFQAFHRESSQWNHQATLGSQGCACQELFPGVRLWDVRENMVASNQMASIFPVPVCWSGEWTIVTGGDRTRKHCWAEAAMAPSWIHR